MIKIKTSNGYVFLIDDIDYEKVIKHSWFCNSNGKYISIQAGSHSSEYLHKKNKKQTTIRLSRYILGLNNELVTVDHIDRNPLNNQRINLRICTKTENNRNRTSMKYGTSRYLGVWRTRDTKSGSKRYRAKISHNGICYRLGTHKTQKNAAIAYNKMAIILFGEYANLNKI